MKEITKKLEDLVDEKIGNCTEKILDSIAETRAEALVHIRVEKTVQLITEYETIQDSLKKIKPDLLSYDEKGEIVSANYSRKLHEEKKKLQENLKKVKGILDDMAKQDYKKLDDYKLFK